MVHAQVKPSRRYLSRATRKLVRMRRTRLARAQRPAQIFTLATASATMGATLPRADGMEATAANAKHRTSPAPRATKDVRHGDPHFSAARIRRTAPTRRRRRRFLASRWVSSPSLVRPTRIGQAACMCRTHRLRRAVRSQQYPRIRACMMANRTILASTTRSLRAVSFQMEGA